MAGRQGFITNHLTYVYQNAPDNASAAFGVDTNDLDKWKVCAKLDDSAYLFPVSHLTIDPAANGNITLTPNGAGKVIASYLGIGSVVSSSTGELTVQTPGVAGTVLMSNGVALAPTWQTPSLGVTAWTREAATPVATVINHGYIPTGGALTTFLLPATAALGDTIEIAGESAFNWVITQNANQQIQFGIIASTLGVGGSLASTNAYDCVRIVCRVAGASTRWSVVSNVGVLSVT